VSLGDWFSAVFETSATILTVKQLKFLICNRGKENFRVKYIYIYIYIVCVCVRARDCVLLATMKRTLSWWSFIAYNNKYEYNFYRGSRAPVDLDLHYEVSRSHSDTPHSVELLQTSDQPDAGTSTWQHATLTPPSVRLEPAIPATQRPQTHFLDRAATDIGNADILKVKRHLWVLQHLCLEGVLYSYLNEFLHSSPEALHTKQRERPLLAKEGSISEFS
jgi:hypothetical protein